LTNRADLLTELWDIPMLLPRIHKGPLRKLKQGGSRELHPILRTGFLKAKELFSVL